MKTEAKSLFSYGIVDVFRIQNFTMGQPLAHSAANPDAQAYTSDGFEDTVPPKEMTLDEIKKPFNNLKVRLFMQKKQDLMGLRFILPMYIYFINFLIRMQIQELTNMAEVRKRELASYLTYWTR